MGQIIIATCFNTWSVRIKVVPSFWRDFCKKEAKIMTKHLWGYSRIRISIFFIRPDPFLLIVQFLNTELFCGVYKTNYANEGFPAGCSPDLTFYYLCGDTFPDF